MRRCLKGSRVLITGASQGIGRALAVSAAKGGARLVLVARSADLLRQLAHELQRSGAEVETVVGDVTCPTDRRHMLDAAVHRFGGLDILINNAGIGATGHFCDAAEDRLRKIMEVNFFALTEVTRLAIPILREGTRPMIVNLSSMAGKIAIPARSEYTASKFAVQGFTEALRGEMARFDIDVLAVCPGLIATNFAQNMIERKAKLQLDHMRSVGPESVAEAILNAVERGKSELILPFKYKLMALLKRFFPRLVDRIMTRKVRKLFRDEIEARCQLQEKREPIGAR